MLHFYSGCNSLSDNVAKLQRRRSILGTNTKQRVGERARERGGVFFVCFVIAY